MRRAIWTRGIFSVERLPTKWVKCDGKEKGDAPAGQKQPEEKDNEAQKKSSQRCSERAHRGNGGGARGRHWGPGNGR